MKCRSALAAILLSSSFLPACGSPDKAPSIDTFQGAGNGGSGGSGGSPEAGPPPCEAPTQFIYVLTAEGVLQRFDPPTRVFTSIGKIDCSTSSSVYSMAVDRSGHAWTVMRDGSLFRVDTTTAHCISTSFVPGQSGFVSFGMGFSWDPATQTDTLYVTNPEPPILGIIDTKSLKLTSVGTISGVTGRSELTGTGDGRLFGSFEGSPWMVAEIDPQAPGAVAPHALEGIDLAPHQSAFAFAFWGGDFWLFIGVPGTTDVYQYPLEGTGATKVATVDFPIVGAGVSTCVPSFK